MSPAWPQAARAGGLDRSDHFIEGGSVPEAIACLLDRVHYVRAADNEALAALLGKDTPKPCGARLLHPNRMGEQDPV